MRPAETLMAGGQNSRHRWAEPLTEGWPCSHPGLYPHSQAGRDPCPMAPTLPSEMNGQLGSRTTPRTSRCVRALAGVRGHFGRESILKGSPSARRHNGNFVFVLAAPPPADIHDAPNHAPRRTQDMARQRSRIRTRPLHRRILYRFLSRPPTTHTRRPTCAAGRYALQACPAVLASTRSCLVRGGRSARSTG